ncbi:MAG: dicarboxylate/amino acid:cation symporter [Planctomycetota bacterium]
MTRPSHDPEVTVPPSSRRKRFALHTRILIGLTFGACLGLFANYWGRQHVTVGVPNAVDLDNNGMHDFVDGLAANFADPVGKIFLRLIFMVVVPLVFAALVLGVYGLGDLRRLGRVGLRTLFLTVILSLAAVAIGVGLVNIIQPGGGLRPEQRELLRTHYTGKAGELVQKAKQRKTISDTLVDIIPENPLQEMVGAIDGSSKGNGMLAVMFFALMFGAALTLVSSDRATTLVRVLEAVFDACMAIIGFAMRLAPYAVAALVFAVTARLGIDVLSALGKFVVTVLLGLTIHLVVVYSLTIRFLAKMSPLAFFRKISDAMLTAFGTSSSNATLPTALRVADQKLGLPREVAHFVLTVGATGNQNGTALYEGVVVLFLAQVFGVDLTIGQQITVVLMSILAGVGTAGVPGGSLPLIVIVLQTVGVPGEGIGIILGADRILDMCRTVLNVTGDLTIAACVSASETENPENSISPPR